jgi:hypothetical protein
MIFFSVFGECLWQALLEILNFFPEGNTDILPSNEIIDCDIIFFCAGKFGGILAAIPQPIVAAILCITFGMVGEYLSITMTNFVFNWILIL